MTVKRIVSRMIVIFKLLIYIAVSENSEELPQENFIEPFNLVNNQTCIFNNPVKKYVFPGCKLYLAKSTIKNSGLGIFHATPILRGYPILPTDVIIQFIDYLSIPLNIATGIQLLTNSYAWNGEVTGGQYEGQSVMSIVPGVGSLSNGLGRKDSNILPFQRDVDESNIPRSDQSMAGSFTHYHNYTFYARKVFEEAGMELFVDNEMAWLHERGFNSSKKVDSINNKSNKMNDNSHYRRGPKWLREHGTCLDNLLIKKSTISNAGRGAFARRYIPKDSIVAPVPIIPITNQQSLHISSISSSRYANNNINQKQLLLNYCFGHKYSSILFFPYSPVVNLINHAPFSHRLVSSQMYSNNTSNVRLKWSTSTQHIGQTWPHTLTFPQLVQLNTSGLMLEYVAIKDIFPNEEVFFDYGINWENAYLHHLHHWEPVKGSGTYSPSYVTDDVVGLIRTEKEQIEHPYGSNLFTSCFYQYSLRKNEDDNNVLNLYTEDNTAIRWIMTRGIFDYAYLRPCNILKRERKEDGLTAVTDTANHQRMLYTVRMRNRPNMDPKERIPKGRIHMVSGIPRMAIRFSDRLYTTDQHLENSFRHEIGFPNDIYPEQWRDIVIY